MSKRSSLKERVALISTILVCFGAFSIVSSCAVQLGLKRADTKLSGPPEATPAALGAFEEQAEVTSIADWEARKPKLVKAFEDTLYGPYPKGQLGTLMSHKTIQEDYANGMGRLEEFKIQVGGQGPVFNVALVVPNTAIEAGEPAPLILAESFCRNQAVFGHEELSAPEPPLEKGMCGGGGFAHWLITNIFGDFIEEPPFEEILARGYAYASIYASEIAADDDELFKIGLDKLALEAGETAPVGIISAWAAGFGWALDVLDTDARLDASKTAVWGHSRHGKASLWASANDPRIEAVISHQSGTGGGALSRSLNGESVAKITKSYPFWFSPEYAKYSDEEDGLPIDQHQLIALSAPKPVLLGNSWNDVWSDPNGTYRAVQGAAPVYELYGKNGLMQQGMNDQEMRDGELFFQISKGRHGIRQQDWDDFLDFLDRWFQ